MPFHGALADLELAGYLLLGRPRGHNLQNLDLPMGKEGFREMGVTELPQPVQEPAGHSGLNHGFPFVRRPDGLDHLVGRGIFQQVALGSSLYAAEDVLAGGLGSENYYFGI